MWFSLSHGIVNEVYYPRLDHACVRDFGLILSTDQGDMWEEKRLPSHQTSRIAPGVPGYSIRTTFPQGHVVDKRIITDPNRDSLLERVRLMSPDDQTAGLHLSVLLAPHLVNRGGNNSAWLGEFKGSQMLFAEGDGVALALACDVPFSAASVGFVGNSDGWQDIAQHGRLTWRYTNAENGNVALAAELDFSQAKEFTLALGFGAVPAEAAHEARASLLAGFERAERPFVAGWQDWSGSLVDLHDELAAESATVIRVHESQSFPGGIVASLSVPWGSSKGDDDIGGYHLVWPRDLVESMGGLLAIGALADAARVVEYLRTTQESDGSWPQNMWLDGTPYWGGIQMDETAFPILAADAAIRNGSEVVPADYWPMMRRAAGYLVVNGPVTDQDRWEEDAGFSPFTLAVEVAALVVAADYADLAGESEAADFLRVTADAWNSTIDRWTYVSGTELARECGVDGYYVRIGTADQSGGSQAADRLVSIKNRLPGSSQAKAGDMVSPDALALVRFGLRDAHDPRVIDTIKVIDHLLKVDLPQGPAWLRYNGDGYGEHEDGSPFDGTGVGRPWPLLTGERAHYELAAGDFAKAKSLADTFAAFGQPHGLIPEQVWDGPEVPDRELTLGGATGSARPLVWAHAEYLKLRRSLLDGEVFDRIPQTYNRYVRDQNVPVHALWSSDLRCRTVEEGMVLRVLLPGPGTVAWEAGAGQPTDETRSIDSTLGIHYADLSTARLKVGSQVSFTVRTMDGRSQEKPHLVEVVASSRLTDSSRIVRT